MADRSKVQVDLIADPEGLNEQLAQAEKNITAFGNKIQTILDKIASGFKQLGLIPGKVLNGIATGFQKLLTILSEVNQSALNLAYNLGILENQYQGVAGVLNNYISSLNKSYERQSDLALAVRLSGDAAGYTVGQLNQYAEYLEKVTRYEKDATQGAEILLSKFRDIRGKQFLDAIKSSQDLSTALRVDLTQAINLVGSSLQNPLESFAQLENVGIRFTNSEKQVIQKLLETNKVAEAQRIILGKLNTAFGGAAKAAGDTFAGTLDRVKNRLTTVANTIGSYLIASFEKLTKTANTGTSIIEAYVQKIESLVPVVTKLIDEWTPKIIELGNTIKERLIAYFPIVLESAVHAFVMAQTVYDNFGRVVDIVSKSIELSFVKLKNNIIFVWQEVLPKTLDYAGNVLSKFGELLRVEFLSVFRSVQYNLDVFGHNFIASFLNMKDSALHEIELFVLTLPLKIIKLNSQIPGLLGKLAMNMGAAFVNGLLKSLGPSAALLKFFGITLPGAAGSAAMSGIEAQIQAKIDEFNDMFKIKQEKPDDSRVKHKYKDVFGEADVSKEMQDLKDAIGKGLDLNERQKTPEERVLEEEINSIKNILEHQFGPDADADTTNLLKQLNDKLKQLKEAADKANKEFLEKFGRAPGEPGLGSKSNPLYDRQEAIDKKLRDAEAAAKQTEKPKDRGGSSTIGLTELESKISSAGSEQVKALKENTAALKNNSGKMSPEKWANVQEQLAAHRRVFDERFPGHKKDDERNLAKQNRFRPGVSKPLSEEEFFKKLDRAEAARKAIREVRANKPQQNPEIAETMKNIKEQREQRVELARKRRQEREEREKIVNDKATEDNTKATKDLAFEIRRKMEANTIINVGVV